MTGQDFGVFFDRYVVGSDPLPLEIVGDSIVVHFESPVSTLPGDFDGDGTVDFEDFVMFARAFGQTSTEFDLTGDNLVRFEDFVVFAQHFGQSSG